jgi:hypothetical protein
LAWVKSLTLSLEEHDTINNNIKGKIYFFIIFFFF